jgi:hypothetical protein
VARGSGQVGVAEEEVEAAVGVAVAVVEAAVEAAAAVGVAVVEAAVAEAEVAAVAVAVVAVVEAVEAAAVAAAVVLEAEAFRYPTSRPCRATRPSRRGRLRRTPCRRAP